MNLHFITDQLRKDGSGSFGNVPGNTADIRYSPGECVATEKRVITGSPNEKYISTSFVERQNLTVRMSNRRMTRLTNAFSKKLQNHSHAIALHYMHYNHIRKHMTLKTTPAVAAGIASKPLTILGLIEMIEAEESKLGKRLTNYLPSPPGE
jgi:hypothetical protein